MEKQEYILCAAIIDFEKVDMAGYPLIYCGHRHNNILWQGEHVPRSPYNQGFLTSTGRYVDRKEGMQIALDNLQIPKSKHMLYSEDLY